jgi:hypothetical protein
VAAAAAAPAPTPAPPRFARTTRCLLDLGALLGPASSASPSISSSCCCPAAASVSMPAAPPSSPPSSSSSRALRPRTLGRPLVAAPAAGLAAAGAAGMQQHVRQSAVTS